MIASFAIPNEEDPDLRCTTHLGDGPNSFPFADGYHVLVKGRTVPALRITTKNAQGEVVNMTTVLG
jgi:hypothetical protein